MKNNKTFKKKKKNNKSVIHYIIVFNITQKEPLYEILRTNYNTACLSPDNLLRVPRASLRKIIIYKLYIYILYHRGPAEHVCVRSRWWFTIIDFSRKKVIISY